ncbi:MAG: sporulation protein [Ferruginibacter sp.]|nr:sporulation protein [Ferruginibacter sp.]
MSNRNSYNFFAFLLLLAACQEPALKQSDEPAVQVPAAPTIVGGEKNAHDSAVEMPVYSNERFRNILVNKYSPSSFTISGEARVFEAMLSWIVVDGKKQLLEGHQMASAGAPEWGAFKMDIHLPDSLVGKTLQLILFEASAKDGSPQFRLPIPLD